LRRRLSHRLPLAAAWLFLGALALAAGCAGSNPYPVGSYERGVYFADKGKNLEAVSALETFVRYNPTDSLAASAQFLKAKTYMEMDEYPLAAVEFQILRKDYPTSPLGEEALFREGECYLEQVGRIERDITGAYEARLHFLRFSQDYPSSVFMPEVMAYMAEISDLMVRKRLEQVKVYRQLGRHRAVGKVLDGLLEEEAGSTLIPEVLWERAQNARRLGDVDREAQMYERLIDSYPDSRYTGRARSRLAALDNAGGEDEPGGDG